MKLFADGADLKVIEHQVLHDRRIQGFTLNTTLMRKAGITDYMAFARELLSVIPVSMPVSLPVLSDDHSEMRKQALRIFELGPNIYVKVPVVDTGGNPLCQLIGDLSLQSIPVNVTGIMTVEQVLDVTAYLEFGATAILSVFAGRIANTGRDPIPVLRQISTHLNSSGSLHTNVDLLWASVREPLNVVHAEQSGCDIITLPVDILNKLSQFGADLNILSTETVKGFHNDGLGYTIEPQRIKEELK